MDTFYHKYLIKMCRTLILVCLNYKAKLLIYSPDIGQKTVQYFLNEYHFSVEILIKKKNFSQRGSNSEISLCISFNPSLHPFVTTIIP